MEAGARREYVQAIVPRYRTASRAEKGRILDEFCQVTGYHRKSALRRLSGRRRRAVGARRRGRPAVYGPAVASAVREIWTAAGYPWSLRLQALMPLWLSWAQRHFRLSAPVSAQLQASAPGRSTASCTP